MRKKVPQPPTLYDNKPQYTSEPYLTDEADTPVHQPVRRGSQRRSAQNNQSTHAPGECFVRRDSKTPRLSSTRLCHPPKEIARCGEGWEADCSIFLKDTSSGESCLRMPCYRTSSSPFANDLFFLSARRKSNAAAAFLDVPGANFYNNNDDTVTLRTFSASNKGSR